MPKITLGQERRAAKRAAKAAAKAAAAGTVASPVPAAPPVAAPAAEWVAWSKAAGNPVATKAAAVAYAKSL
jgi:hypothetical protein